MTDIKTILAKGKLTGEEVGRIFLRDFVRGIEAIQSEQTPPKDKFTDAEQQIMVNNLTEPYEIRQYNTYIGIIQFLQKTAIMYTEQYKQLKYLLVSLHREIDGAKQLETVKLLLAEAPLILTETQYNGLKKEDLESKLVKKASVASIILTATEYYFKQYQLEPENLEQGTTDKETEEIAKREAYAIVKELKVNKNLTPQQIDELQREKPYGLLFEAYKKQPLTNPEFKKNYWQEGVNGHYETPDGERSDKLSRGEWVKEIGKWHAKEDETGEDYIKWVNDSREAPPDATKHNILEFLGNYFNVGRVDFEDITKDDLETFKKDYPDIYEAILTELKGIKGLGISDIKAEDYTKPLISYKTLYDLDLAYYKEFFVFNPKDGSSFIASFISIIPDEEIKHWGKWKKDRYLDKEGNYKYQFADHEKQELTEMLPLYLERARQHLQYLLAIQEIYAILGEQLGEESISDLATDKNYIFEETGEVAEKRKALGIPNTGFLYKFIEIVNEDLEEFKHLLRKTSPVIDKETIKEIHEAVNALELIKIKELKPTREAVSKVKELTRDLNYYGQRGLSLHDILMGTV